MKRIIYLCIITHLLNAAEEANPQKPSTQQPPPSPRKSRLARFLGTSKKDLQQQINDLSERVTTAEGKIETAQTLFAAAATIAELQRQITALEALIQKTSAPVATLAPIEDHFSGNQT